MSEVVYSKVIFKHEDSNTEQTLVLLRIRAVRDNDDRYVVQVRSVEGEDSGTMNVREFSGTERDAAVEFAVDHARARSRLYALADELPILWALVFRQADVPPGTPPR